MQRAADRVGHLAVGHRVRRGQVHRAADAGVRQQPAHHRDPVVPMDPRHDLPARAQGPAGKEVKRQRELLEGAAAGREHQARPQQHDACVGLRGARLPLPVAADGAQEVGAGRRRLVERFVVRRAVVADRRSAQERRLPCASGLQGRDHGPRRLHAARLDRLLAPRRPPSRRDRFAGQVDHRAGALERAHPAAARVRRAPLHLAATPLATSGEHHHVVGVAPERVDQWAAEEAGAAGHNDFHDSNLAQFVVSGRRPRRPPPRTAGCGA